MNPIVKGSIDKAQTGNVTDREIRRAVNLDGFALLDDGSTFGITVADLSYEGCRIKTPIALIPGLNLKISVSRLGVLSGHVRWYAEGHAGISFHLADPAPKQQTPRADERSALSANVRIRRAGRQQYDVRIFDLSRTGCKVEFVERPTEGEQLWVKFDGLNPIEAHVRWVDGCCGGLQFSPAIYPAVFDVLLRQLSA